MLGLIPAENWEYSIIDFFYGVKTLLISKKDHGGINIDGIGDCIPIRSGRAALVAAIKALGLKPGSKIGVPLYSCPVVFKAVKKTGCTPVFIDIERDNLCISANDLLKKINQVDAVIAIHMFGNLCDMNRLVEVAQGKPIIEDCAQSLGSKINGRMTGTIGSVGIFSFRSGKYLSVGEGGSLFSKDKEIKSKLLEIISSMQALTKSEELKHIIKTYLRSRLRSKPLFGFIGKKIWQIYNKSVDYSSKTPIVLGQISKPDLYLTNKRLSNFGQALQKQRANAEYYLNNLKLNSDMFFFEKPGTFNNGYAYPIIFSSIEQRDAMADYLYKHSIDTVKPYQDIVEIAAEHYDYRGDCLITESLSKRILLIPSYYKLNQDEVKYIANCINECWEDLKTKNQ